MYIIYIIYIIYILYIYVYICISNIYGHFNCTCVYAHLCVCTCLREAVCLTLKESLKSVWTKKCDPHLSEV